MSNQNDIRMKKGNQWLVLVAVVYLIIEIATSALRGINFILSSSVMFPVYLLLTFFVCKGLSSVRPWKVFAAAGLAVLLPYVATYREFFIPGHLDVLIRLSGIGCGVLFFRSGTVLRCVVVGLSIALVCCFTPLWYGWINYLSMGSFRMAADIPITRPIVLTNRADTVVLGQRAEKIYVLDLWNSSCGYCMTEFPRFQAIADKFKDDGRVVFCTAQVLERKWEMFAHLIPLRHGSSLPSFVWKDNEYLSELGIKGVPHVLVVSPDDRIVYRGNVKYVERHVKRLLRAMP